MIVRIVRTISTIVAAALLAACGAMNPTAKPQAAAPSSSWQQVVDAAERAIAEGRG